MNLLSWYCINVSFSFTVTRSLSLGDHYSEDTFYYLEDRVRVASRGAIKDRERTGVRIDFWCVSHQTFILVSKIKQHIYSHANYTFSAHIAGIACFRNHVIWSFESISCSLFEFNVISSSLCFLLTFLLASWPRHDFFLSDFLLRVIVFLQLMSKRLNQWSRFRRIRMLKNCDMWCFRRFADVLSHNHVLFLLFCLESFASDFLNFFNSVLLVSVSVILTAYFWRLMKTLRSSRKFALLSYSSLNEEDCMSSSVFSNFSKIKRSSNISCWSFSCFISVCAMIWWKCNDLIAKHEKWCWLKKTRCSSTSQIRSSTTLTLFFK